MQLATGPMLGSISFMASYNPPLIVYLPVLDILLPVGLKPYIPHRDVGILILPKASLQRPNGAHLSEIIPP